MAVFNTIKTEFKKVEATREFAFPSYFFWHGAQPHRIVRHEMAYYQPADWNDHKHVPNYIKTTVVDFSNSRDASITATITRCENGVIPQDFFTHHDNDYGDDNPTTDVQFENCWDAAIKLLNTL